MDDELNGLEWTIDAVAALLLSAAAGWACFVVFGAMSGAAAASLAFCLVFTSLRRLSAGALPLAGFMPAGWDQVLVPDLLELTEALPDSDEPCAARSVVVQLFPDQPPLPSAGEMRASIERHLRQRQSGEREMDDNVTLLGADASAALRRAIQELRHSLG
jgi:hypothetical protein